MKTIIISLGGSIIVPDQIDTAFLNKFKELIEKFTLEDNRVIIITGGGKTCRRYQEALRATGNVDIEDLDWLGISTTHTNGNLVRLMFKEKVHPELIIDPTQKIKHKT